MPERLLPEGRRVPRLRRRQQRLRAVRRQGHAHAVRQPRAGEPSEVLPHREEVRARKRQLFGKPFALTQDPRPAEYGELPHLR